VASILVLELGIPGYVGKAAVPLVGQLGGELSEGFFVCFSFPLLSLIL
jgi:hypothetical protein